MGRLIRAGQWGLIIFGFYFKITRMIDFEYFLTGYACRNFGLLE
jgi:hypothetical protein